jgi:hypothetical protein
MGMGMPIIPVGMGMGIIIGIIGMPPCPVGIPPIIGIDIAFIGVIASSSGSRGVAST